jgi:flagellin
MSVVINTNYAATVASNNLASSNASLQKSLNRLSTGSKIVNPADDAGGLAVSMKLTAAAQRQGAALNNISNSVSFLQTQDGALKVAGKVLERISELKVLSTDVTKSGSDRANYNAEYTALKAQLTALAGEKFNGVSLFGSSTLDVSTTESGGGVIDIGGADLFGGSGTSAFSDSFANLSSWGTVQNSSAGSNALTLGDIGLVRRTQAISGAFDVTFNVQFSAASNVEVGFLVNNFNFASLTQAGSEINDTGTHSVKISFDGAGNASTYLDGSTVASDTATGLSTSITDFALQNTYGGGNTAKITNFDISTGSGTPSQVGAVASQTSLSALSLSSVSSAIEQLATLRADNGAKQSRLGFASELLSINKANLEAATSRITDVDVATESTSLARYNVLVQAGTSMLAQANQSTQIALKLLQ